MSNLFHAGREWYTGPKKPERNEISQFVNCMSEPLEP